MSRDEEGMTGRDWRTAFWSVVGLAIGAAFTIGAAEFMLSF